ncbi:MAG: TraX family protein [Erysipelotrichaceae bacterium]
MINKLLSENNFTLTSNQLKLIAIVAMFLDHFFAVFVSHNTLEGILLRFPGRIVAPIICFLMAEGFHYTSNRKKYILRLLALAVVSHLPYNLLFGFTFFQATSVIWALVMGLIALSAVKSEKVHIVLKPIIVAICSLLAITANWNYVAVLWIVSFGIFRGDFKKQILGFSIIGIIFHLIPTYLDFGPLHEVYPHWYQLGIFLAIPILVLYNGKLGKKSKIMSWSFYIFYPAHLLFLFYLDKLTFLAQLMGNN